MSQATLPLSRVEGRLRRLRGKISLWFLADGLAKVLLAALMLIGLDVLLDWTIELDRAQRIIVLVLCAAILVWFVWRWIVRPMSYALTDDALVLEVEDRHRELGQGLISAVQFARMDDYTSQGYSPAMVEAVMDRGFADADRVVFEEVLRKDRFQKNILLAVVGVLGLGGVAVGAATTDFLGTWANRNVMLGDAQWPQDTYLVVEGVQDGKLIIPRGDDWPLTVTVRKDSEVVPNEIRIDIRAPGSDRTELMEYQKDEEKFELVLKNVLEPFEFRARSSSGRTDWIAVDLVDRPAVESLELSVTAPKYAGGKSQPLPAGRGPYYVLKGSTMTVKGVANKPLSNAVLRIGKTTVPLELDGDKSFHAVLPADKVLPGTYDIVLRDRARVKTPDSPEPGPLESKRPTRFTVKTRADREPRLTLKLLGVSSMVVPGARIPCTVSVTDDFKITGVRLVYRHKREEGIAEAIEKKVDIEIVKDELGKKRIGFGYDFDLGPLEIPAGSGLSFFFEADDDDDVSGPKTGQSKTISLRVVGEDELRTNLLRREKEQRQEFERLLKTQEDLATDVAAMHAGIRGKETPPEQRALLQKIQKKQKLLAVNVAAIAKRLDEITVEIQNNKLEEENGPLMRRLRDKIINPMKALAEPDPIKSGDREIQNPASIPKAAQSLDRARRQSAKPEDRDKSLKEAVETQNKISEKMRDILKHLTKTEGYQEAVNLLYEIQKSQRTVADETDKKKQERIRKILEQGGKVEPGKQPDKKTPEKTTPKPDE